MKSKINFFFNGEQYSTSTILTLEDLLVYFNYTSSIFVVEYNQFICNKEKWKDIKISSNDKIEIITIVGGG